MTTPTTYEIQLRQTVFDELVLAHAHLLKAKNAFRYAQLQETPLSDALFYETAFSEAIDRILTIRNANCWLRKGDRWI